MESKYIKQKLPTKILEKIYNYLSVNNIKCSICNEIIAIQDFCIRTNKNEINCLDCFNKKQIPKNKYTEKNTDRFTIFSSLK